MQEDIAEKLQELEFAIEAAELGTWSLNPATGRFRGNSRLKEWFGLKPEEEILLANALSVIDSNDRERVKSAIALAMQFENFSRYDVVYRIIHPVTRLPRTVHAKGKAWYSADHICYRFNGTVQDITENIHANQKIIESEAKYRDLFKSMDQGFCILEMITNEHSEFVDYVFLELNPVFELQTGLKNAAGRTAKELVPGLEQKWIDTYGRVAGTGEPIRFVQGSEAMGRWFEVYAYKTGAPEHLQVALLFTDITARKLADLALERSEQNLRSMLLQAPIAICIFRGADLVVEIANEKMLQLFGRSADEVIGRPVFQAMPEVKDQGYEEKLQNVLATGEAFAANDQPVSFNYNGRITSLFVDLLYHPLRDSTGLITGVLGVAHDVTDKFLARKTIEENEARLQLHVDERTQQIAEINNVLIATNNELARSNTELHTLNDQLAQYAYVASHDLQEPLRKIRTFGSMIELMPDLPAAALRYIQKVTGSAERMTSLIKDLLEFSTLAETSKQLRDVDLNQTLAEVVKDFELALEETGGVISLETLPVIEGVPLQFNQLFYNLIGNALKFISPGRSPRIEITSSRLDAEAVNQFIAQPVADTSYYRLSILDNGIGFENKYAEHIFEVFKRLHARHKYPGSGIGLSLCRKIVELHHGRLTANGTPDTGAVFQIILPEKQPASVLKP